MNYEQMACNWAKAGVGSEGAVAFAVLHLATQVERIADGLDKLAGTPAGASLVANKQMSR